MKNKFKILITVCLLLSFLSRGQTLFFDKYYKVGYTNAQNNNVLLLEDSSYALLSYVKDSATGRQDLGLYKIDKSGNLLNSKLFNYFNLDYLKPGNSFNNFINASGSSLMAVAGTYSSSNSVIIFSKINKQNLDTIKTNLFCDFTNFYNVGNLIKMNSNKFLAVGLKSNTLTSQYWPVIIELDSNLVIKNMITCANTQSLTCYNSLYDKVNKKLVFSGYQSVGSNVYGFVAIADTLGNITNTYIYNDGVGNAPSQVFYSAFDNTYITVGSNKTGSFGGNARIKFQICKYNASNLSVVWQKSYGFSNISTVLYDAVINADGSIIAVGMYCDSLVNTGKLNYNGALIKIRNNGDSLWMRNYDNYYYTQSGPTGFIWEALFGIEKTPEGGYVMCGTPTGLQKAKAWVIKTDSLGCTNSTGCGFVTSVSENSIQKYFKIYPNPVLNTLKIDSELNDFENIIIEITNSLGQIVSKQSFVNSIDVSQLSQGLYSIKITESNHQNYISKFIKE